ncbi:MAG: CoA ester lyase [Burkholderiaceae bacterium]
MTRVARSYLFVPGDRGERIAKACASGTDAVIVDFEDAVAPENKLAARNAVRSLLGAALNAPVPLVLRINAVGTVWFEDDARLAAHPAVAAIMLPKAEDAASIQAARQLGGGKPVIALVETAVGMAQVEVIAATPGVVRLAFGSIDFQLDLDIEDDDEALQAFRSRLVLASRVAGLQAPVDGVTLAIDDPARIEADARRARAFGFGGKLCIHPKQVALTNAAFGPSAEQLVWARRVIDAAAAAQGAAVAVDGRMVDAPVLARARRVLSAQAAS